MKNISCCRQGFLLCLLFMVVLHHARAQNIIYVTPGTDVTISPGTNFTVDLLTLTPSSAFTLSGVTVTKNATTSRTVTTPYISRVYAFSSTTAPFSGDIQMGYQDGAELNGLPEASLQLNIYNGVSYQAFIANTNNTVSNFVLTTSLNNVALNELALAGISGPLPLLWGKVLAYRQSNQVFIDWQTLQENNVAYFNIEKNTDGGSWSPIIRNIPARNLTLPQQYQQTDPVYSPGKILYRVIEVDLDGRSTYSRVVGISAENSMSTFVLSPNPVENRFYINGDNMASLKEVKLFNSAGVLLKTWQGADAQGGYSVDQFPAGVYYLRLAKTDGSIQYDSMVKK